MCVVNASESPEEIKERLVKSFNRLEAIENDLGKGRKDLRESFREQVNSVVHQLWQHFLSDDIKERFTNWSEEDAPDKDAWSWKEVEENVNAALSRRFLEIVDQWEEENKVFSTTRTFLMEQFPNCLKNVEFKLQNVQTEAADADSNNPNKAVFINQLSFWQKAICNVLDATGVLGRIVYGMDRPEEKLGYRNLLVEVSKDFLTNGIKKKLKPFVEDKLKGVKLYLDRIEAHLQEVIEADRQLYEQLSKRSARYKSVFFEVKEHVDQLALFGLVEVCPVKINLEELEWKEEASSCLGRGAFGVVYQGTMRRDGEVTTVALKVWNEALYVRNAEEIMTEIKNLR